MLFDSSMDEINLDLLNVLLIDRTTNKNIIWATSDYGDFGEKYVSNKEILSNLIIGVHSNIIQPRVLKSVQSKKNRVRSKAEIFTPSWMCNEQNNLIDEAWFGRANIFNKIVDIHKHNWQSTTEKIVFDDKLTWQSYVDINRLEITCGEAPYLVSRYDTVSGEMIPIENRIGLLDRKLRVINENITTKSEWLEWTKRAFQSVYGYEFQGDSLLLARKNMLMSYIEYYRKRFYIIPNQKLLEEIAEIISWNLWQMDGLTNTIPYANEKLTLFDKNFEENIYCKIKDWRNNEILEYRSLLKGV